MPPAVRIRAIPYTAMTCNRLRAIAALTLPLLGLPQSAQAQTAPDAGRLLEETRPAVRPAPPSAQPPKVLEVPVRPTIVVPDGVSVLVSDFRISGASSFPPGVLADLVKPWVGRRLDISGLNEAAGAITRYYQAAGHLLSYAYLPAQRVADGTIEIAVLEGRIDGAQVVTAQEVRLRDEVVQAHTAGLTSTQPVVQADVERQLLLLNDIPGVAARAAFTPGAAPGAAAMVVSVAEEEPLELRAELNNHGSKSTGEYRAGLTLQLRDLFGWGDATTARALLSNEAGLVSGGLSTSVPLGGQGWRLGANVSRLTYELGNQYKSLGARGTADEFGLDFSYALLRSSESNLNVRLGAAHRRLLDEIQANGDANPKRNDVVEFGVSFDRRDGWGGPAAGWAGSVTLTNGNLQLLDPGHQTTDATGLNTARSYRKAQAQLVRQQPLFGSVSVYVRYSGQASGGNLDSSEKLALGGPYAVRAYGPGEANVDQGSLGSAELRYAFDYLGGSLIGSLFYDYATGVVNRRPLATATSNAARLQGAGLGLQWYGGDYGLSASVAVRGKRLPTTDGGDPRPRLYLQFTLIP